jgi:hypothetical protein
MRFSWKGTFATVATAGLLVVAADYVSYAATGDSLVLGRFNSATTPTTLTNTGDGPALRLNTSGEQTPPLAVDSAHKVLRLNADEVDGRGASELATHVLTYTGGKRGDEFPGGLALFDVPVPPGIYQASFTAGVTSESSGQTTGDEVICGVADLNTLGNRTHVFMADSTVSMGNGAPAFLSGAQTVRITANVRPGLVCSMQTSTTVPFGFFSPLKASFAKVDSRMNLDAPPVDTGPAPQRSFGTSGR